MTGPWTVICQICLKEQTPAQLETVSEKRREESDSCQCQTPTYAHERAHHTHILIALFQVSELEGKRQRGKF